MKNISQNSLQNLPSGIQESIMERSQIYVAVENCKTFIKYAKTCVKTSKDPNYKDTNWIEIGQNSLKPYFDKLLEVDSLVKKYHLLWADDYDKVKNESIKLLNLK